MIRIFLCSMLAFSLWGCGGGSSSSTPTLGGPTVTPPVVGLDIPTNLSLLTVKATAAPTAAAVSGVGKFPSALSVKSDHPGTDFANDETEEYVYEDSMESLALVNEIVCLMSLTQASALVNKGPYIALMDEARCRQGKNQSSVGETGQSSGGNATEFTRWVIESTRLDNNSPQIVRLWVPDPGDGEEEPWGPQTILVEVIVTEGVSDTSPLGSFDMRFRGVGVFTNTPPKSAQRGPGGAQIIGMLEPLMDKAARELGVDRLALRRLNAPEADVEYGPRGSTLTSVFVREAIDQGRELFGWEERIARSGQLNGTKRTGIGVGVSPYTAGSSGFDGLLVIRPDGIVQIHQGLGNLGTNSNFDTARAAADVLGVEWDQVEVVFGDTSRHLPWSSVQAGSQTIHAHTRANHAAGLDAKQKLQEIAARDLGGRPEDYDTSDGRVYRRSNPSQGMTLGRAATRAIELGGRYSGEEFDDDLNDMTKASVTALAGQGLVAAARDTFGGSGGLQSWVVGFAEVELDIETGKVDVIHYTAVTDCGVVVHPRGLGGQIFGGSFQGMGMAMSQKWVFDPVWGVSFAKRLYTARPPGMLDVPIDVQWAAVGIPDPQTPVGAKGIGEPCVGAGSAALTSAIADALEGKCLCRTPLSPDVLLAELEGREPAYGPLDLHV
ncbi:MAG: molybdopterin-dependent oxidoreductase [Gemmatimonadetes bacterium]|nr:molybdopterin-dependent oxidoreductase [Gemmatimonadota bacterium]